MSVLVVWIVVVLAFSAYMAAALFVGIGLNDAQMAAYEWRRKGPRGSPYMSEPDSSLAIMGALVWPLTMWLWVGMVVVLRRQKERARLAELSRERDAFVATARKELEAL